jgi:hypothetical protein
VQTDGKIPFRDGDARVRFRIFRAASSNPSSCQRRAYQAMPNDVRILLKNTLFWMCGWMPRAFSRTNAAFSRSFIVFVKK